MTPLPVIPNVYRVACEWASGSDRAVNVLHVLASASTPAAVSSALQAALSANPNVFKSVASSAFIEELAITPLDGVSTTSTFAGSGMVGGTSGSYAPAVATVVQLQTGHRGGSYRGRVFLPMTADSAAPAGVLVGGTQSAMVAAWNAVIAALSPAHELVVASYQRSLATPVTGVVIQLGCATQRRRQERVRYP